MFYWCEHVHSTLFNKLLTYLLRQCWRQCIFMTYFAAPGQRCGTVFLTGNYLRQSDIDFEQFKDNFCSDIENEVHCDFRSTIKS